MWNMGKVGFIMGASKTGKTTSLRTLDPKKTVVFSPLSKGLPFEGSATNYTVWDKTTNPTGNLVRTSSSKQIVQWLKHISASLPDVTVAVIDDNTFVTAKELSRRKDENGFQKYNDIANDFLELAEVANSLRADLNIYILHHTTTVGDGILEKQTVKAATFGKLIDEKLHGMEAQFEIVFLSTKTIDKDEKISYRFKTRDAYSTCGTPMGMFEDEFIDNDLQAIDTRIRCFYQGNCDEGKVVKVTTKTSK